MISANYCRHFARYNSQQNASLVAAADGLSDTERWLDRGAFFESIAATLNHLYWTDKLMLERINGNERPQDTITHSLLSPADWSKFKDKRARRDAEIEQWANGLSDMDLNGRVAWYPLNAMDRIEVSKAICVVQLFNHQTHHRGQIHAMLTSAGVEPKPTDILFL
ncbi:DinB family protein [Rhodobacteraceae bacterium KLH11]|nr:DinB family protein [Rhodobacteraceae bacterium KLH11]